MNRRERKHVEKQLGLQKHYKTLSRTQRWEKMRDNQQNGKRMMEELKNKNNVDVQDQEDTAVNDKISKRAKAIAKSKKIPLIDALVEAQEEFESKK